MYTFFSQRDKDEKIFSKNSIWIFFWKWFIYWCKVFMNNETEGQFTQ